MGVYVVMTKEKEMPFFVSMKKSMENTLNPKRNKRARDPPEQP
jgi:hypothetical protein